MMAKHSFELQHTGRPFGPAENIPDAAWRMYSRHTTLSAAQKALGRTKSENRQACGQNAWSDHYRLIALRDTPMTQQWSCTGPIPWEHNPHCERYISVPFTWPAGHSCPESPTPAGWRESNQCSSCNHLEMERDQMEREANT